MFDTHGMAALVEEKESQTFELISTFLTRALTFPGSHWLWAELPLLAIILLSCGASSASHAREDTYHCSEFPPSISRRITQKRKPYRVTRKRTPPWGGGCSEHLL